MNFENRKKIKIIIPEDFIEKDLSGMIKKFNGLRDKFLKLNRENSAVCFDLGIIKKIDFFGYQYIYFFYRYLQSVLKIDIVIEKKSLVFAEYEKKYGLNIGE